MTRPLLAIALPLTLVAVQARSSGEDEHQDQRAVLQAHYERAETELRAADVSHLDPVRAEARADALDVLRAYRLGGDFGRGPGAGGRALAFVDDEGRRCAVAELLHAFGEEELVQEVALGKNEAFVHELAGNQAFLASLDRMGLTLQEAARIQGPRITFNGDGQPINGGTRPVGDRPSRPSTPTRPSGPTSPARPRAAGPSPTPGAPSSPAPSGTPGAATPAGSLYAFSNIDPLGHWSTWWEFNKLGWLVRPIEDLDPAAGRTSSRISKKELRAKLAPLVRELLHDGDAGVRAAAAITYARLDGEDAVDLLVELFEDRNVDVRTNAILALGAVDSEDAVYQLLKIAHRGSVAQRGEAITSQAQTHATLALALARERGLGEGTELMLPAADGRDLEQAIPMHALQAPSEKIGAKMVALSGLYREGEPVRRVEAGNPRAIEALRSVDPDEVLAGLLRGTLSRDVEVRRSSAATLGRVRHDGALAPLMTAFEVEREPLTRGFLLIAIGRQGGDSARAFLIDTLKTGPRTLKPWCALALGISASEHEDAQARAALRDAYAKERNSDAQGAYLLAMGIARDQDAYEILSHELRHTGNETLRAMAALGLGLSGHEGAASALREALTLESSPATQTTILQGLACVRAPEDGARLVDAVRDVRMPEEQVQLAAALAFHGSLATATPLADVASDESAAPIAKAAALQALGMLLDDQTPFRFATLSGDANYSTFLEWVNAPLQSTL